MNFRLTSFEIEESFGKWKFRIGGDLVINGINTRIYDFYKIEQLKTEFKTSKDLFDLNFNDMEKLASSYYIEKVTGRKVQNIFLGG